MDSKNNKKKLEEYKKNNNVDGGDILEAVSNNFRKKIGLHDFNTKSVKIKFANRSLGSKIYRILVFTILLSMIVYSAILGFKNLFERQYKIQQMEVEYNQQIKEKESESLRIIEEEYIRRIKGNK